MQHELSDSLHSLIEANCTRRALLPSLVLSRYEEQEMQLPRPVPRHSTAMEMLKYILGIYRKYVTYVE